MSGRKPWTLNAGPCAPACPGRGRTATHSNAGLFLRAFQWVCRNAGQCWGAFLGREQTHQDLPYIVTDLIMLPLDWKLEEYATCLHVEYRLAPSCLSVVSRALPHAWFCSDLAPSCPRLSTVTLKVAPAALPGRTQTHQETLCKIWIDCCFQCCSGSFARQGADSPGSYLPRS